MAPLRGFGGAARETPAPAMRPAEASLAALAGRARRPSLHIISRHHTSLVQAYFSSLHISGPHIFFESTYFSSGAYFSCTHFSPRTHFSCPHIFFSPTHFSCPHIFQPYTFLVSAHSSSLHISRPHTFFVSTHFSSLHISRYHAFLVPAHFSSPRISCSCTFLIWVSRWCRRPRR